MSDEYKIEMVDGTVAPPYDEAYAEKVQDMMELDFPDGWFDFLGNHNGGVPVRQLFKLGSNVKVVDQFLCLEKDYKEKEFFGQFDQGVVWSQIEERLSEFHVPFAAVSPGDFLCFDLESSDDPPVVLWVHDRSGINKPFTVEVASDFKTFLAMLKGDDEV